MSQHIGPRTISAIGGSIKRVGPYRIHTFPSELVTDGLVLNLDAGDPRSYPGSGTTWTDLSGNGNNGTFGASTAAPTYNNANGGSLLFDGTNDYVSLGTPSIGTGKITVNAWIKITSGGIYQHIVDNQSPEWHLAILDNNRPYFFNGVINHNSTPQLAGNVWYMLTGVQGITNDLYINGVLSQSIESNVNITTNTLQIGRFFSGPSRYFNGNISNVSIYNRALSAAEVAQNYDALKVRYTGYTNTFTPTCGGGSGKVEVLCVAGGGGGGTQHGGGGGAGGLIYNSAFTVNSNTGIGVTVGGGGAGSVAGGSFNRPSGGDGGQSVFSTITSQGGGGGSSIANPVIPGRPGGSGGGCALAGAGAGSTGTGGLGNSPPVSPSQGNAGGAHTGYGPSNDYGGGGGGGGASTPGQSSPGSPVKAGNGGDGTTFSISGTPVTYAGGGGGGSHTPFTFGLGGLGGGGNGGLGNNAPPIGDGKNGIPNTGSGGGGGGALDANGGGGSNGIIIVRYPATDYNVELLVVGGGGGGGGNAGDSWNAGGGGAGGLIYYSSYPISAGTKYTITVGAGGIPGISTASNNGSTTTQGANGGNSILGPLVAIGGGGGGASSGYTNPGIKNQGLNGGSGGGSGVNFGGGVHPGGFGVSGQGNSGGQGASNGTGYSGGGGGAGGPGTGPGVHNVTNFGPGLVFSITGSSVSYAQGGQGGREPVTNAAANSGTGGDGARSVVNTLGQSGAGGSGIIIIAYQGPQRGVGGTVDTTSRPGYTLHKFTTTGTDFFIP